MQEDSTMLRCAKDDHEAITAFAKKHGVNLDSASHYESHKGKLRCWKEDYAAVEMFCEKYGLCYGEIVENNASYNVFFTDVDGDEIECCLSKNSGDLSGGFSVGSPQRGLQPCTTKGGAEEPRSGIEKEEQRVNYTDIVLYIPLNERDLKTDVCAKLLEYCLANNVKGFQSHEVA